MKYLFGWLHFIFGEVPGERAQDDADRGGMEKEPENKNLSFTPATPPDALRRSRLPGLLIYIGKSNRNSVAQHDTLRFNAHLGAWEHHGAIHEKVSDVMGYVAIQIITQI